MIGGIVVEVVEPKHKPNALWVNCEEENSSSQCAIYVQKNAKSRCIQPGDTIWWQGSNAMWTPFSNRSLPSEQKRCGRHYDIRIPRIGFSGVNRPEES